MASPPDFSSLTRAEASALETLMTSAIIAQINAQKAARISLNASRSQHWTDMAQADLDAAIRLELDARDFQRAAHQREQEARRDECVAVRMVHAFAIAAMRAPVNETSFGKAA